MLNLRKANMHKGKVLKVIIETCLLDDEQIVRACTLAKEAGAFIVGTGSSEFPNQINNALVFPGLFRGAIDANARTVNDEMMFAASIGIANCVKEDELSREYILPKAYDKRVHQCVAEEVRKACIASHATKQDK